MARRGRRPGAGARGGEAAALDRVEKVLTSEVAIGLDKPGIGGHEVIGVRSNGHTCTL